MHVALHVDPRDVQILLREHAGDAQKASSGQSEARPGRDRKSSGESQGSSADNHGATERLERETGREDRVQERAGAQHQPVHGEDDQSGALDQRPGRGEASLDRHDQEHRRQSDQHHRGRSY